MTRNKVRLVLMVLLISSILASTSEPIFLYTARAGSDSSSSDPQQPDIGIVAYINTNNDIDLETVKDIFYTIDYQNTDSDEVLGTYRFYVDNYNTEDINLYLTSQGFIAVYYSSDEPASRLTAWSSDTMISSKLATAITSAGQSLGQYIDYKKIKYYDYRYPDANRMLIVSQSSGESMVGTNNYGNLQFNIPNYATVYETSYSTYLNDPYSSGGTYGGLNIAIDTDVIYSTTYNGVFYDIYDGYISKNIDHLLGIMSGPSSQAGVAMIIIYKDDDDDANNRNTIKVSNADNSFDGILEIPDVGSVPNPIITQEPTPEPTITTPKRTPRPARTPTITVPMPTAVVTEIPEDTDTTPVPTQDILRKPPKASIDLHGERTNIEVGQQSLLKGSIVSFNTNKDNMHAQVIIIPPSGVSVVSADFVKGQAGQYTSDFELEPGKAKDIEVAIVPNEPGEFKVMSKVSYYFGSDRDDNGYDEMKLDIKVRQKGSGSIVDTISQTSQPGNVPKEPGFDIITGIGILTVSYLYFRKRK